MREGLACTNGPNEDAEWPRLFLQYRTSCPNQSRGEASGVSCFSGRGMTGVPWVLKRKVKLSVSASAGLGFGLTQWLLTDHAPVHTAVGPLA
ncbi:hypothetical protein ACE1SV_42550 [Streptomyces sennicomposti]